MATTLCVFCLVKVLRGLGVGGEGLLGEYEARLSIDPVLMGGRTGGPGSDPRLAGGEVGLFGDLGPALWPGTGGGRGAVLCVGGGGACAGRGGACPGSEGALKWGGGGGGGRGMFLADFATGIGGGGGAGGAAGRTYMELFLSGVRGSLGSEEDLCRPTISN